MTQLRCIIIGKRPLISELKADECDLLEKTAPERWRDINASAQAHITALRDIEATLDQLGFAARSMRVDDLTAERWTKNDVDLVITVGGDGTLLATHPHCDDVPVLPINSDPNRSVGWLTVATVDNLQSCLQSWLANGQQTVQSLPRLQAALDGAHPQPFLNDCLLTNSNPAALSRYQLKINGHSEKQSSSGIWISTAAGSTGAIFSAGGLQPQELPAPDQEKLLYHVREPLQRRYSYDFLYGSLPISTGYQIQSLQTGLTAYLDGAHRQIAIPAGRTLAVTPAPRPLQLAACLPANRSDQPRS